MTISGLQPLVLFAAQASANPAVVPIDPAKAADMSKPAEAAASLQLTNKLF